MSVIPELVRLRIERKKTVRDVAKSTGLHENTIRNAEKGRNAPTIEAVEAWAESLGARVVVQEDADISSSSEGQ